MSQLDVEKTVWTKEMQRLEKDLAVSHEQLRHCETISTALQTKLRLALEDLQETRMDLEDAHVRLSVIIVVD